jgi:hypothetical protein
MVAVSFANARSLADTIRHAELIESRADSHFVWLGADWPAISERIRCFPDTKPYLAATEGPDA